MAEADLRTDEHGTLFVSGALDFSTAAALSGRGGAVLDAAALHRPLCIDLSGVTRTDSAGIALLIGWLRIARGRGVALELVAVSEQMVQIARTCGVLGLLGLDKPV